MKTIFNYLLITVLLTAIFHITNGQDNIIMGSTPASGVYEVGGRFGAAWAALSDPGANIARRYAELQYKLRHVLLRKAQFQPDD